MRTLSAALVAAFLFLLFPTPSVAQPLLWEGAIGRLETRGGICTFFVIDRRDDHPGWYSYNPPGLYLIASAGHCYSDDMWIREGPDRFRVYGYGFTSGEYGTDLMLGTFYSNQKYRVFPLANRLPEDGEWVRTVGFPTNVYRDVVAQARMGLNPYGRRAIVIDVAVSPGISGGPVLSLDGQVLGVLNLRSVKNPHRWCGFIPCQSIPPAYAVPIDELAALIAIVQK